MGRAEDLFARLESEGVDAINDLFEQKESEEAFLDFKRSADQGAGVRLHDDDRKNLSRALSGFANTDGGVIVWGVGTGAHAEVMPHRNVIRLQTADALLGGSRTPSLIAPSPPHHRRPVYFHKGEGA